MSFMKNLLPTTLPVHMTQYHHAGTTALHAIRQAENLLIAMDLVTHPWDDLFLRSSLRELSRALWEETMLMWSYTRSLTNTVNDIHRGTAVTINFNPVKYMTTVQNVFYNINNLQESCMSFINVSHQLRYMSLMNMNILTRELYRLGQYVTTWQTQIRDVSAHHATYLQSVAGVLGQNNQEVTNTINTVRENEQHTRNKYDIGIEHVFSQKSEELVRDTINDMDTPGQPMGHVAYQSPREYQTETKTSAIKKPKQDETKNYLDITKTSIDTPENGGERHSQIINMVRNRGVVSINDIAEHFPVLSRKTLQRDLSELIDQGKIIRSGDKRWALYRV